MLGAGRRKRSCKHNIVVLVFFLWFVFWRMFDFHFCHFVPTTAKASESGVATGLSPVTFHYWAEERRESNNTPRALLRCDLTPDTRTYRRRSMITTHMCNIIINRQAPSSFIRAPYTPHHHQTEVLCPFSTCSLSARPNPFIMCLFMCKRMREWRIYTKVECYTK